MGDQPDFNFVHAEPRYQAIGREMKLPHANPGLAAEEGTLEKLLA